MTTESLSVTIEGEVIAVEIGTVAVAPGGGSGDVVGPASAADGALAVFDGTTGKLLAEGTVTGAAVAAHMAGSTGEHGMSPLGANLISSATQSDARNVLNLGTLSTVSGGTGVATALAVNVGSNGSPVIQGGGLGTPSSGDLSNVSGLPPSGIANAGATLGQVITWSGSAWVPATPSLTGGTPGGSGTELQYRIDGTTFGGMAGVAWDDTNRCETRTGATVTTSKPVQSFTQTWNSGGVTFTGWKINITDTASASASMLIDLQVGGTTRFNVSKAGNVSAPFFGAGGANAGGMAFTSGYTILRNYGGTDKLSTNTGTGFCIAVGGLSFGPDYFTAGASIVYDAANTLNMRNGANAQTLRVSGTHTDASNYVRAALAATSTAVSLTAETAGTGADDVPLTVTAGGVAHVISGSPLRLPSFTVAALPSAATAAALIYVSNESGGAVLAFSDGTNWRRVTDRAIVS